MPIKPCMISETSQHIPSVGLCLPLVHKVSRLDVPFCMQMRVADWSIARNEALEALRLEQLGVLRDAYIIDMCLSLRQSARVTPTKAGKYVADQTWEMHGEILCYFFFVGMDCFNLV